MTFRAYLSLLRRRWAVLLVAALVGLAVGFFATDRSTEYRASAYIHVGTDSLGLQGSDELPLERIAVIDRLVNNYATVGRTLIVGRDDVLVVGAPGTQYLEIRGIASDPEVAAATADDVAAEVVDAVLAADTLPDGSDSGLVPEGIVVAPLGPAAVPVDPVDNDLGTNIALGGAAGLLLAAAGVLAADAFTRDADDDG